MVGQDQGARQALTAEKRDTFARLTGEVNAALVAYEGTISREAERAEAQLFANNL